MTATCDRPGGRGAAVANDLPGLGRRRQEADELVVRPFAEAPVEVERCSSGAEPAANVSSPKMCRSCF